MSSKKYIFAPFLTLFLLLIGSSCDKEKNPAEEENTMEDAGVNFYFGADLSYVNQILDKGGSYRINGVVTDPYEIFKTNGTNLVRLRLWHHPEWTKTIYGSDGTQLYNDLNDVEKAIKLSQGQGMQVLLDFHYSDTWADPGNQEIPMAWREITSLEILADSVYAYTFNTINHLNEKGLMPEFIQIGNETNCGLLYTNAPKNFPSCNVCNDEWLQLKTIINSAIAAIEKVEKSSTIDTKIVLHVADPVNVDWWFENISGNNVTSNFDVIGFSYYPLWHTGIRLADLENSIASFKSTYEKEVMILEVAYPWTTQGNDEYANIFGPEIPISEYEFTPDGQLSIMKAITQAVKNGGGIGIIYWEPAWISSEMKDKWGTGSSWENNAFFDYNGNLTRGIDYMTSAYE